MPRETEQIEAKLCAYVDGELDAAGCAEIEKYLTANPQQRKLIDELRQTRQMVRDLPRESAPRDLIETLQGHLERSALLGTSEDDETEAVVRLRLWPQVLAMAAIVLLTIGLGVVVYHAMPPTPRQPGAFTLAPRSAPADESEMGLAMGPPAPGPRGALSEGATGGSGGAADIAMKGGGEEFAKASPRDRGRADGDVFGMKEFPGAQARQNRALLVVATDDPGQANTAVVDFLTTNEISWEQMPEPMPEPLGLEPTQRLMASRLQQRNVRIKDVYAQASQDARKDDKSGEFRRYAGKVSAKAAAAAPAPANSQPAHDEMHAEQQRVAQVPAERERAAQETEAAAEQAKPREVEPLADQRAEQPAREADEFPPAAGNVIIARNVTKQQAQQLYESLSQQRAGQRAVFYDDADADAPAELSDISRQIESKTTETRSEVAEPVPTQDGTISDVPDVSPLGGMASEPLAAHEAPATQPAAEPMGDIAAQLEKNVGVEEQIDSHQASEDAQAQAESPDVPLALRGQEAEGVDHERIDVVIVVQAVSGEEVEDEALTTVPSVTAQPSDTTEVSESIEPAPDEQEAK